MPTSKFNGNRNHAIIYLQDLGLISCQNFDEKISENFAHKAIYPSSSFACFLKKLDQNHVSEATNEERHTRKARGGGGVKNHLKFTCVCVKNRFTLFYTIY